MVEGRPCAGAGGGFAGLPLGAGAATGGDHVFALGATEGIGGGVLALGGDVENFPAGIGGDEAACQVVLMPAGEDEDDLGAGGEAGGEGVGPPVPACVADDLGVGLDSVLDGVVDDEEVGGAACDAASASDAVDAPGVPFDAPFAGGAVVVGDGESEFGVCGDGVADGAAVAVGESLPIAAGDDAQVGVVLQEPDGQVSADAGGLAFLGWHGDDEPPVGGVGEFDQGAVDEVEGGGLDGAGVDGLAELSGCGVAVAGLVELGK